MPTDLKTPTAPKTSGASTERAQIVEWLRAAVGPNARMSPCCAEVWLAAAEAIEQGDHWGPVPDQAPKKAPVLRGPAAGRILAALSSMPYGALVRLQPPRVQEKFTLDAPSALDADKLGAYLEDLARVLREYGDKAPIQKELDQLKADLAGFRRILGIAHLPAPSEVPEVKTAGGITEK